MFDVHPSARDNFNSKVTLLVDRIVKAPQADAQNPRFKSEVHVAATIKGSDIIGEPKEAVVDYRGKTIGRFFLNEGERYGITDESYNELAKLAESIQKLPSFRKRLSNEFVEECIFTWLKAKFIGSAESDEFMSFLVSEASKVVKPITVIVPIAKTIVEVPFEFCGATIRNLTKATVDEMASMDESLPDEENKKKCH